MAWTVPLVSSEQRIAAACRATLDVDPALPLQPNTNNTFNAGCAIECGADDACPGELTCDADLGYCVSP